MSLSTISALCRRAHKTAKDSGFYETPQSFGDRLALIHSELSEALEEYRDGRSLDEVYYSDRGKPEGIPAELADAVIRIFDLCGAHNIDLERVLLEKMAFNETRPYRHGGKKL